MEKTLEFLNSGPEYDAAWRRLYSALDIIQEPNGNECWKYMGTVKEPRVHTFQHRNWQGCRVYAGVTANGQVFFNQVSNTLKESQ